MKDSANIFFTTITSNLNTYIEQGYVILHHSENKVQENGYGIIKFDVDNYGTWEGPITLDFKVDVNEVNIFIRYKDKAARFRYTEHEIRTDLKNLIEDLRKNAVQSVVKIKGQQTIVTYK